MLNSACLEALPRSQRSEVFNSDRFLDPLRRSKSRTFPKRLVASKTQSLLASPASQRKRTARCISLSLKALCHLVLCFTAIPQLFYYPILRSLSSCTVNAVLEAARANNSPVMIQVSNGGGTYMLGKGVKCGQEGAAAGSIGKLHKSHPLMLVPVVENEH